ncbi:polysaccharide deacetylase family protein [Arsenicicoccus dermatophilus]|uniref:polysaccharide deacetylase family protein n=1 Tax=Arsenicicoccus dermatophilus TaxID=1076331 RepID=UPI001F4C8E23|nr:polysaccharide deacetylase family protein [Arsenicicoccus dermatophilus]MCH8613122.1 polysaccharide deacetylase family protein [Arsenicicoccus dermatophilus]
MVRPRPAALLAAVALSLGVAGIAGCDVPSRASAPARTTTGPAVRTTVARGPGSADAVGVLATTAGWESGPRIPALAVPGVVYHQDSSESTDHPYAMRWPQVPSATALNQAVQARVDALRKEHLDLEDGEAELHVNGAVVAWSAQVVAVRLTALVPQGAKAAVTHTTTYGDRGGSWVASSQDLIAPSQRDTLLSVVRRQLALTDELKDTTAQDALTDITVTPQGGLRVVLDEGAVASLDRGILTTEIPAAQAAPMLSDRGREVVAAVRTAPAPVTTTAADTTTSAPEQPSSPVVPAPAASAVDCRQLSCVALTFDDGPGPYTAQLLDELSAAGVRATFFALGQNVQAQPDVVRRAVSMGMVVGNHTWDHRDMRRLGEPQQRREIEDTDRVLGAITGAPGPTLVRPPYGSFDATTKALGHPLVLWDVDTEDWKNRDVAETTRRAVEGARAGSIVLMHDIHPSTVKAVPGIVKALKEKGLTLVTVPELMGPMAPGSVIFRQARGH